MKPAERKRLTDLLAIQSHTGQTTTIRKHVRACLEDAGCTVRQVNRQLYARKGTSHEPIPFVVAHSDTVHHIVAPERYAVGSYVDEAGDLTYYAYDPTTRMQRGIGGDDKCGLWVAIEAARRLADVAVIITVDEEIGAKGARRIDPLDLANAAVLIQADRRGGSDAISDASWTEISSPAWRDHVSPIIEAYGYDWTPYGSLTDVSELVAEGISTVSAVNLSAGYYDAHTSRETVREHEVETCLELTVALARASAGKRWTHTPERQHAAWGWGGAYHQGRSHTAHWTARDNAAGDHWDIGGRTFRRDDDGAWRVLDETPAPLVIIPCDVPGCPHEAEDWDADGRMTLCGGHLDIAYDLAIAGYDPATIAATLS